MFAGRRTEVGGVCRVGEQLHVSVLAIVEGAISSAKITWHQGKTIQQALVASSPKPSPPSLVDSLWSRPGTCYHMNDV